MLKYVVHIKICMHESLYQHKDTQTCCLLVFYVSFICFFFLLQLTISGTLSRCCKCFFSTLFSSIQTNCRIIQVIVNTTIFYVFCCCCLIYLFCFSFPKMVNKETFLKKCYNHACREIYWLAVGFSLEEFIN